MGTGTAPSRSRKLRSPPERMGWVQAAVSSHDRRLASGRPRRLTGNQVSTSPSVEIGDHAGMPTRRFYQEPSLNVATYDALNSAERAGLGVEGDVDFYRSVAADQGGPILELGCGTGRVAFPLAEDGFEVVGIDRSTPMLAVAESKRRVAAPEVASRI